MTETNGLSAVDQARITNAEQACQEATVKTHTMILEVAKNRIEWQKVVKNRQSTPEETFDVSHKHRQSEAKARDAMEAEVLAHIALYQVVQEIAGA